MITIEDGDFQIAPAIQFENRYVLVSLNSNGIIGLGSTLHIIDRSTPVLLKKKRGILVSNGAQTFSLRRLSLAQELLLFQRVQLSLFQRIDTIDAQVTR